MKILKINKKEIKQLYKKGQGYSQIAVLFGVSRQRIHQIVTGYISPQERKKKEERIIRYKKYMDKIDKAIKKLIINKNITKITELNGDNRNRLRELIRKRDNYSCQMCGKKWKKGKRRLDVHHIDGDKNKTRKAEKFTQNITDNMITLCHKCHLSLHKILRIMKKNNLI